MKPWIIHPLPASIGKMTADSRNGVLAATKLLLEKGATLIWVVGPDNTLYIVKRRSKKEPNALSFEKVSERDLKRMIDTSVYSFAVFWRTRGKRSIEIDDNGREKPVYSAPGPWNFHSRWPTRDEAVAAAIKVEREPEGKPEFGVSPDDPQWAIEARIEEVRGKAPAKAPPPEARANVTGDIERIEAFKKTFKEPRARKPEAPFTVPVERKKPR